MSVEQIIVLVGFVIAMLVRAMKQTVTEAEEQERAPSEARVEEVRVKPPARRAAARDAREPPRRVSRRETPGSPPPPRNDIRRLTEVSALRRAIVLATILGPPRALQNAAPLDSRER